MIKITNYYSSEEIERYYKFLRDRKPKKKVKENIILDKKIDEVGNEIISVLNKLLRENKQKEISNFQELITMSFSELKEFHKLLKTNEIDYTTLLDDKENKKLFDTYIGFYTKFFTKNDKQIKLKNNISLMKDLGVTVCPYCNRNYINSRHDKLGCEFDHYYSKDKFPFFALTLSNLVPSCSTCNRIKQANDYEFCPFDLERREKVKFIVSPPSQNSKIGIYFDGISQKDNLLQLESAYEIHKIDVDEMFMKEEKYCKEYRDYLISLLGDKGNIGNEFSEEFFDSMIFGEIANDSFDDYLNHSLSKLKKDTYDYIVELREK